MYWVHSSLPEPIWTCRNVTKVSKRTSSIPLKKKNQVLEQENIPDRTHLLPNKHWSRKWFWLKPDAEIHHQLSEDWRSQGVFDRTPTDLNVYGTGVTTWTQSRHIEASVVSYLCFLAQGPVLVGRELRTRTPALDWVWLQLAGYDSRLGQHGTFTISHRQWHFSLFWASCF